MRYNSDLRYHDLKSSGTTGGFRSNELIGELFMRSHTFHSKKKLTKATWLRLFLSAQFLLSSFAMPLQAVAADKTTLDSAVTSGSADQTADAVSRVISDTASEHSLHEPADENPSGWESAANELINSSENALKSTPEEVNETASGAKTQAPAAGNSPLEVETPTATAPVTPAVSPTASATTATGTPVASPSETAPSAPVASSTTSAPSVQADVPEVSTETKPATDASPIPGPSTESAAGTETAATPQEEPNKQIAEKTPIVSEPAEVRADGERVNKDGIGGFIGDNGDGEVALLEHGFVEQGVRETLGEVIVIDNDEAVETETIPYEELPTDDGKTKIVSGAQFPVVMSSQLNSKNNKKGDTLQARLKYDLKIGDRLVAEKGALVTGHINYNLPARSVMHSLVTPKRWYKNSGVIGITFDEIINSKKEHIALNAKPARKSRIVRNKAEGRELGVNDEGQIVGPWGQQLKYKAIRVGLNFALAPAGVFSFGAMPVALGVIGAVNPSFAFMKPVGTNVRHRRIKGFAWGFLSGVPGSWIIEDTVTKGQECIIKPGDEFLVELKQEFTGEARSEASIMPGSSAKVRGQVLTEPKEKKSKKK